MRLKNKFNLFGAYLFRWIGFPVEPDLIKIGNPTKESPVFLTCNLILTVRRVMKALKGIDCFLLIAPSNGINVWCGACGDEFNTNSVISIMKTSEIDKMVAHKTLILPQLSAPGIDPKEIKRKLGWNVRFGPVYAKDIPSYLKNNMEKEKSQRQIRFPFSQRFEIASMYFFMLFLLFTLFYIIITIFLPILDLYLYLNTIFISIIIIYGSIFILPSIKGENGAIKILFYEIIIIFLITFFYLFIIQNLFYFVWMLIISILVSLLLSEDFHGLTPIYKSGLGEKSWKKGKNTMKTVIGEFKLQPYGEIELERDRCIGCMMCLEVCPRNVFIFNQKDKKVDLKFPKKCVNCNACVKRCLGECLYLK